MRELQNIIQAFKGSQQSSQRTALATVVKTSGSVYRRPGARMLLIEDGQMVSAISGGCLESDVFERAQPLMFYSEPPIVVRYDTNSNNDTIQGWGLGCNGVVNVLIESLGNATAKHQIKFIADCLHRNEPGVIATVFHVEGEIQAKVASRLLLKQDSSVINDIADAQLAPRVLQDARQVLREGRTRVQSYKLSDGFAEVLIEAVRPPVPLLIFGAGYDAIPMVDLAKQLGWHVTVIDRPPGYAMRDRFPSADKIVLCSPEELQTHLTLNSRIAAVVMTHKYLRDKALLRILLSSPVSYVGVLGPKTRTQRLLQDLQSEGLTPTKDQLRRLYGPVGLDLGADTPEEIALSIVAEIQAVLANRSGRSLRDQPGSIHSHSEELICLGLV
jgi:xanthine/CO dehydrogenase XdhC/CoxF family maturation factor